MRNIMKKSYALLLFLSFHAIMVMSLDYSFSHIVQNAFTYDFYLLVYAYKSLIMMQLMVTFLLFLGPLPITESIVLRTGMNPLSIFMTIFSPRSPPFLKLS